MDHRSWPWKKKSSNKTVTHKAFDAADPGSASLASVASLPDQGNCKNANYVQIPLDTYTRLSGLEDQVKVWQNQVKDLEAKLSSANSEIAAKDILANQHSKVAEEAVTGWEKADAEASALKQQLESVTLLKLSAEDRAAHLDDALKECLRQLRVTKEEHHEEMNELILTKTKQCDQIKADLGAKFTELDQMLLRAAAENAALSRSLQEHSDTLLKINDEKSQVEVRNELLKKDIQSCEKEISSLKYEVNVLTKELDIRNEEKNMSMKSAEAANKQYMDGVKKIANLEGEIQKLRGFVRKKLPGPAALAQMKQESDSWGHGYGESRSVPQRPSRRNSLLFSPLSPESCSGNLRQHHKEIELLTERLYGLEEETKMLKEALATRNSELQSSRDLCAEFIGKIKNLEIQVQVLNQRRNSPRSILEAPTAGSSPNATNMQIVASVSEDGYDYEGSLSESWVSSSTSNLAILRKGKSNNRSNNAVTTGSLERLAHAKINSKSSFNHENTYHGEGTTETKNLFSKCCKLGADTQQENLSDQELVDAVICIRKFLLFLKSNLMQVNNSSLVRHGAVKDYEEFSASMEKFILRETSLNVFFLKLSCFLEKSTDLIVDSKSPGQRIPSSCQRSHPEGCLINPISDSKSEVPTEGNSSPSSILNASSCKCSLEMQQLKVENDDLAKELARCNQELESKRLKLEEIESLLTEARSELASSRKCNGLAETQLKCMAESYKILEIRAQELEVNVENLQAKTESLDFMLEEEKRGQYEALARCEELQDQTLRKEGCPTCSLAADIDIKSKQERKIADAAATLAECQETIYLLGKQLKALHPQTDSNESQYKEKLQMNSTPSKENLAHSFQTPQGKVYSHRSYQSEDSSASSFDMRGVSDESPLHGNSSSSPSSGELNQRANESFSSSSSLLAMESQHSFTRFFPPKGKY